MRLLTNHTTFVPGGESSMKLSPPGMKVQSINQFHRTFAPGSKSSCYLFYGPEITCFGTLIFLNCTCALTVCCCYLYQPFYCYILWGETLQYIWPCVCVCTLETCTTRDLHRCSSPFPLPPTPAEFIPVPDPLLPNVFLHPTRTRSPAFHTRPVPAILTTTPIPLPHFTKSQSLLSTFICTQCFQTSMTHLLLFCSKVTRSLLAVIIFCGSFLSIFTDSKLYSKLLNNECVSLSMTLDCVWHCLIAFSD